VAGWCRSTQGRGKGSHGRLYYGDAHDETQEKSAGLAPVRCCIKLGLTKKDFGEPVMPSVSISIGRQENGWWLVRLSRGAEALTEGKSEKKHGKLSMRVFAARAAT